MIMGVSSILLAVTFLVSAAPCLYLHMRRQNQLLRYWMNLEDYDEAVARQHSEEAEKGDSKKYDKDNKGRSTSTTRSLPRRGLLDRRLTNMMFGGGYDDRENKEGKGRRREKQPSQRWSRRSRRPNRKNHGHWHRHSRADTS